MTNVQMAALIGVIFELSRNPESGVAKKCANDALKWMNEQDEKENK